MIVSRDNIDELNAVLKIKLAKEDYEERVNNILVDYRKKVQLDGFRPGKVPPGLVKKMYGKAILVDEINKIISEAISKNITEDKLHILGEPLPSKDQKAIDWDKDEEYEFFFNLGIAPVIDLNLSQKDKIIYYNITVDDKMIKAQKDNIAGRHGTMENTDTVVDNEGIKGLVEELDNNKEVLVGGIQAEDTTIYTGVIKDEKIKKSFIGSKINDVVIFDPIKAFPSDTDLSTMLKIDKEEVKNIKSDFRITISEITKFIPAEIDTDLFDKIYGKDKIKTEEEFDKLIIDEIKINLKKECEYKFTLDSKEKLIKKTNLELPDEFLKRWLLESNKTELTSEKIEEEYPKFVSDLKWQLIKDDIIIKSEIKIEENEIMDYARQATLQQFRQYGIENVPDDQLDSYAGEILKKDEEKRNIAEKLFELKVIKYIKDNVKIDTKELSLDKFNKLFT